MSDRLALVTSSPRLPAGQLSWPAWEVLRTGPVYTAEPDADQARAVSAAGVEVGVLTGPNPAAFREAARPTGTAVWLAGPDGDPAFVRALGNLVAREPEPRATIEVVYGSWDPPGARLLDVVAVADRLRSPDGCPWVAERTHEDLSPYLLEEAYEAYQALEDGDHDALRGEIGDVLFQVVIHSRLAEEAEPGWSVDDVADALVTKLVRRHPHVFGDVEVSGVEEVKANWERIKAAERAERGVTSRVADVPFALPALTLAATLRRKAEGLPAAEPAGGGVGERLFALVAEATDQGLDAEAELRAVCRRYADAVTAAEAG